MEKMANTYLTQGYSNEEKIDEESNKYSENQRTEKDLRPIFF